MRMAAQYEMLTQLAKAGTKLDFGQDLFVKFYQAFIASNRWQQYLKGVIPTLYVTAIALTIGVVLGSVVALVRVAHDQQRRGHHDPALAVANAVCKLYATVIRGTPMMVQMLIMSMVIFANSRNFTMVGTLALIVIPQAIRSVLPALGNEFIVLLKDTSLITVIGGKELLYAAQGIMNRTYEPMFPLFGVALMYLILVMIFTWLLGKLEGRLAKSDRR